MEARRHAIADALAAGLVVEPEHRDAGGLEDVEQILVVRLRASNAALPSDENMHGTEARVLVPHERTSRKLSTRALASSGVVSGAGSR